MRNLLLVLLAACGSSSDGGTSVSGQAVYRDSTTDHTGAPHAAAAPADQHMNITMTIQGTGTIPNVDAQCLTDPTGHFEARYAGSAQVGDTYLASFGSGSIVTPSGCQIPDLTVGVVTDIVVRAEIETTTPNCETYCAASARADAEAQCGTSASCRENAETSATAQCMTTCTAQKTKIVAESSIGASSLGHVDADALRAAAFADLEAKLVFAALE